MPSLIKQGEARVFTKNGEVFVNIALELTIKLDGLTSQNFDSKSEKKIETKIEEKVNWEIPDFNSNKINFGK